MNHVSIKYKQYVDQTSEPDPSDEPYSDRGDTYTTWEFESLKKGSEVPVSFDPVDGKTYYAVIAIYSTGDSFGREESGCYEVLDIYETEDGANGAIKSLVVSEKAHQMTFTMSNGNTVTNYCPWTGHFESLDTISVYPLTYKG
jgi:hypothetical protein